MFRQLVRRASKAPRQRVRVGKSAVSRSAAASTLLVESVLSSSPAAASNGHVAAFHTSAPRLEKKRAIAADKPPFEKLLAANRGEIATRIVRAASELGIQTAGIYAHEGKCHNYIPKQLLYSILSHMLINLFIHSFIHFSFVCQRENLLMNPLIMTILVALIFACPGRSFHTASLQV